MYQTHVTVRECILYSKTVVMLFNVHIVILLYQCYLFNPHMENLLIEIKEQNIFLISK